MPRKPANSEHAVYCVDIPHMNIDEAAATLMTAWNLINARLFLHVLDDIHDSLQETFSLEFFATGGTSHVCFSSAPSATTRLETGIYSIFEHAEVREVEDYLADFDENTDVLMSELKLGNNDVLPLQSYEAFAYDTIAPLVPSLNRVPHTDRVVVQFVCKPIRENALLYFDLWLGRLAYAATRYTQPKKWFKRDLELSSGKLAKEKCSSKLYNVSIRIIAMSQAHEGESIDQRTARENRLRAHIEGVTDAYKVYSTVHENSLKTTPIVRSVSGFQAARNRELIAPMRLSTRELASLWHPPSLVTMPNTSQVLSRKIPPPQLLPCDTGDDEISFFGATNYRQGYVPFGVERTDRRRHFYIVGKSGTGKSSLMQLLAQNDILNGAGCAVLDPHGELVDNLIEVIPRNRLKDVVIFDPSDTGHPPSFNPFNVPDPSLRTRSTLGIMEVFKKVLGPDWSQRVEQLVRYATMALLEVPGSSIVSFRRMLTDEDFRGYIVSNVEDESVRRFWKNEFSIHRSELEDSTVSLLLNRLDQLLSTDMVRNILGQSENLFDFRRFMDSGKIVLIKISKGILGAENATFLGSFFITKIFEAALTRVDVPPEQRRDFHFYIDEFQNFAGETFGEILSESRKYGLCMTVANQYLAQLPPQVRQSIFGNVGNVLSFRVGATDAQILASEFGSKARVEDLLNLPTRDFFVKMSIDGEVQQPFSGRTLDLPLPHVDGTAQACIQLSRSKYSLPAAKVREELSTVVEREVLAA